MSQTSVRVTGQLLQSQSYSQTSVCVIGKPIKVSPNSQEIILLTTDNIKIPVSLSETLQEHLDPEGFIEVRGHYNGKQIISAKYMAFPSELTTGFDAETYSEAVELYLKNKAGLMRHN